MASRRTFTPSGFTLIELVIVVGLFGVVGASALFIDFSSYRGDAFRAERATIVTLLQTARADALNNIDESPHGLAIFPADHPASYVVFEGATYATRNTAQDEIFDASYPISLAGGSAVVVFEQLSGDAQDTQLALTDPARGIESAITINHEGAID
ncbi:MAG TPA: type II secretion system protein [Candidatus Paceibacterota bacterium]|nr:type II secretion system protein [Candidatus Paceibacterota bacterium]